MKTIHGINFAPFAPRGALAARSAKDALRRMVEQTGADTVLLCPMGLQSNAHSEVVDFQGPATTGDEELLDITEYARGLGLRVIWKPTVNCADGTWRAHINFFDYDVPCEPKWRNWFASYEAFQCHFAALAQQTGLEMLVLGCEMTNAERREEEWRRLIASVRGVYDGAVCYNCDKYGEDHVTWWDAVDVIASSGYYPAGEIGQNLDRIEQVIRREQKPFFFAEAGCMAVRGAARLPNDWSLLGRYDPQEQKRWLQELFTECEKRSWVGGFGLWSWPIQMTQRTLYGLEDMPACEVVRTFYQK